MSGGLGISLDELERTVEQKREELRAAVAENGELMARATELQKYEDELNEAKNAEIELQMLIDATNGE